MTEKNKKNFWKKVLKTESCWIWLAHRHPQGYGVLTVSGKNCRAHRFSWELHNGQIPHGLWVLHKCDNPPCVNPGHLFLGTRSDNMNDCSAKGRMLNGEKNHNARLTIGDVVIIRSSARARRALGKEFGVSVTTISNIQNGNSWKHVLMGGDDGKR